MTVTGILLATADDLRPFEEQFAEITTGEARIQESVEGLQKDVEVVKGLVEKNAKASERVESKVGKLTNQLVPTKPKEEAARKTAAWHDFFVRVVRVFGFTFIAAFVPLASGIGGGINNMDAAKAAAWSAAMAGLAAALKVVQASITKDEEPFLDMGLFGGEKKS